MRSFGCDVGSTLWRKWLTEFLFSNWNFWETLSWVLLPNTQLFYRIKFFSSSWSNRFKRIIFHCASANQPSIITSIPDIESHTNTNKFQGERGKKWKMIFPFSLSPIYILCIIWLAFYIVWKYTVYEKCLWDLLSLASVVVKFHIILML